MTWSVTQLSVQDMNVNSMHHRGNKRTLFPNTMYIRVKFKVNDNKLLLLEWEASIVVRYVAYWCLCEWENVGGK